nr:hypothetical protein [Tanacetum cinerariifolium]
KDEEMTNDEVAGSNKGDDEVTNAAKADAEKTSKVKDDAKNTKLPPTRSSLFVSLVPEKQTSIVDLEQASEKTPSEILKTKKEQSEKQKMMKFTIKSTDKAALKEFVLKSALYQTMHANNVELEYHFQEWLNALTDRLDWNNLEGDRYPFDMSKHLPLQGHPAHLTVAAITSSTMTWNLHLNDIEDMLLLAVQHKLFHLTDNDIVDFIMALRVIYDDLTSQKRIMRADALYKFSDETLKKVQDELHHRIRDFCLKYYK